MFDFCYFWNFYWTASLVLPRVLNTVINISIGMSRPEQTV